MVRFKKHVVSYGDTIQAIAQLELGDMNQWVNVAQFNDLKYPYIVNTVEEKMTNPDHLVTVGDTLLIRLPDEDGSINTQQLPFDNTEEVYATALGKDLDIYPIPLKFGYPNYDYEILELKGDEQGNVKTVKGLDNLRQALFVRLITPKGSYVGHPEYGSNLHKYVGKKNTEENATLIDIEVERVLRTDGRVANVIFNQHVIKGNTYAVSFTVEVLSTNDAFTFIIGALNSSSIVLLNDINQINA